MTMRRLMFAALAGALACVLCADASAEDADKLRQSREALSDDPFRPTTATFHYQPPDAVFGDPIPFYHDGVHHVFFLARPGWRHLTSRDLVHWQELEPAIAADENDRMIATGSIVEKNGVFHAFYTTASRKDEGPVCPRCALPPARI